MSLKEDRTSMGDTIWMESKEREVAQKRILEWEKELEDWKTLHRYESLPLLEID